MHDENPYKSPQVQNLQPASPDLAASEKLKQLRILSWALFGIFIVFVLSFFFPLVTMHPDPTIDYKKRLIFQEQNLRIARLILTLPCLLVCFALLRFGNRYFSLFAILASLFGFSVIHGAPNAIEVPFTLELGFYLWISSYALLFVLSIMTTIQRFRHRM